MDEYRKLMPGNELELNMAMTDSLWGQSEISPELKERLKVMRKQRIPKGTTVMRDGEEFVLEEDLEVEVENNAWALLGYYTRDQRLANLDKHQGEVCNWANVLAGDVLLAVGEGWLTPDCFSVVLNRGVSEMELSQSKGGFLREMYQSLIKKEMREEWEGRTKKSAIIQKGADK